MTSASADYSHAEGYGTLTLGNYQHAQGIFNAPSSTAGAFILGNGTNNANRSNLIYAAGNTVQITGSLLVSGSGITVSGSLRTDSTASAALFVGTIDGGTF